MKLTKQQIDDAYATIVAVALAGERCPFNATKDTTGGIPQVALAYLARAGLIKSDIYARNWRVVTILTGEHRGKHTALPPFENLGPYRTLTTETIYHRRVARLRMDRPLTRAERSKSLNRRLIYGRENRSDGTDGE